MQLRVTRDLARARLSHRRVKVEVRAVCPWDRFSLVLENFAPFRKWPVRAARNTKQVPGYEYMGWRFMAMKYLRYLIPKTEVSVHNTMVCAPNSSSISLHLVT